MHCSDSEHLACIIDWCQYKVRTAELAEILEAHVHELILFLQKQYNASEFDIQNHVIHAFRLARAQQQQARRVSCGSLIGRVSNKLCKLVPSIQAQERALAAQRQTELTKAFIRSVSSRLARQSQVTQPRSEPQWPRDDPERERPDLNVSMDELAAMFDNVTDKDRPLLRLLSLRVIGGWSLGEIARRDGISTDQVVSQWMQARALIQNSTDGALGGILTFDLLDLHVLDALMADPALHHQLSWRALEHLIAAILERFGYEIELRRGTKDGGVDIIALKRQTELGPHRYLIQAKRWSSKVGIEPVRELLFLRQHVGATKACLATTSTFTSGAWKLGSEYDWCLELRDYRRLMDWLHQAFPFLPPHL